MRVFEAIRTGSQVLKDKNISSFILDSEILLSKTLNKSREEILTNLDQKIGKEEIFSDHTVFIRRISKLDHLFSNKSKISPFSEKIPHKTLLLDKG